MSDCACFITINILDSIPYVRLLLRGETQIAHLREGVKINNAHVSRNSLSVLNFASMT